MWTEGPWSEARLSCTLSNRRCSKWVEVKTKYVPQRKVQLPHKSFSQEQILCFISVTLNACTSLCFPLGETKTLAVKLNQCSSELHGACINSFRHCFLLCKCFLAEPDLLQFGTSQSCISKIKYYLPNILLLSGISPEGIEKAKERTVYVS